MCGSFLSFVYSSDYDLLNLARKIFKSCCLLNLTALSLNFEQNFRQLVLVYKYFI